MEGIISLLHDQGNAYYAWTKNVKMVQKKKNRETGSFPVEFFATDILIGGYEILMWILDFDERRAAVEVEERKEI